MSDDLKPTDEDQAREEAAALTLPTLPTAADRSRDLVADLASCGAVMLQLRTVPGLDVRADKPLFAALFFYPAAARRALAAEALLRRLVAARDGRGSALAIADEAEALLEGTP